MSPEVYDASGRLVRLGAQGPSGGEGTIWEVAGDRSAVAKIYHPARRTDELRRKLLTMSTAPPHDPTWASMGHRSIAWVRAVLFEDRACSTIAGFTMPSVDTETFREAHLYYDPSDRVRLFGTSFTWRHLLTAATNLCSAVAAVHAEGHRIGDLRETNVLVAPSSLVCLIDCDSFQVRDPVTGAVYPTRVGTSDYLPPELQGADFRSHAPDRYHSDLFGLAVLVFRFLMQGAHPFQARGPAVDGLPSTEAKIKNGLFAYGRRWPRGAYPPDYAPDYEIVPRGIRHLFKLAFVDGHRRPDARPAARDWMRELQGAGKNLRICKATSAHWYSAELRGCPWCAQARATGSDAFSSRPTVGSQIALPRPPVPDPARRGATAVATKLAPPVAAAAAPGRFALSPRATAVATWQRLLRGARWVPILTAPALAGALAPLVAFACLAVVALPALATVEETRWDLRAGSRRARSGAMVAPRLAVNVKRSVMHALRYAGVVVVAGSVSYAIAAWLGHGRIAAQVVGAASAGLWPGYVFVRAAPSRRDAFLAWIAESRDRLLEAVTVRPRSKPWGLLVGAAVCAAMGAAVLVGVMTWWPLAAAPIR